MPPTKSGHTAPVAIADQAEPTPVLLTAKQTEAYTGLACRTLARLTACGALPSVKINRSRRYPSAALRQWIADGCPTQPGAGDAILRRLAKGVRA